MQATRLFNLVVVAVATSILNCACVGFLDAKISCSADARDGRRQVWAPDCKGAGCFANGMDNECAWCVYDLLTCRKIRGDLCDETKAARDAQQIPCAPVISGHGEWRYQFMPSLLGLPVSEANNDENGHGLSKDLQGNIYFTFVPKAVKSDTQVLVRFSPDGTNATLLGEPGPQGLSGGVPHGLRIENDQAMGKSYLYHANNDATVIKTTLEGELVWRANFSSWKTERPEFWPYKPCDAIVVPGTDVLLVADGYGSSFIHALNKTTGQYLENRSFGGKGTTTTPLRFNTPHGINIDPRRSSTLVVSDRSNSRLVWVTAEGRFVATSPTTVPAGMHLPCNVDVHDDVEAGLVAVVPSLGISYSNLTEGSVAIYGGGMGEELLSVMEVARTIGHFGHQHPHDAMFLPNGDVVICCWAGPANPGQGPAKGTISYWKRLPRNSDSRWQNAIVI